MGECSGQFYATNMYFLCWEGAESGPSLNLTWQGEPRRSLHFDQPERARNEWRCHSCWLRPSIIAFFPLVLVRQQIQEDMIIRRTLLASNRPMLSGGSSAVYTRLSGLLDDKSLSITALPLFFFGFAWTWRGAAAVLEGPTTTTCFLQAVRALCM